MNQTRSFLHRLLDGIVFLLLGLWVVLLTACNPSSLAAVPAFTPTPPPIPTVADTPTPLPPTSTATTIPTDTDTPTPEPTPTDTLTPEPTATEVTEPPASDEAPIAQAPTDTPLPPTDTPTSTSTPIPPTSTPIPPTPTPLPMVTLIGPPDGAVEAGLQANVVFEWSGHQTLGPNGYYVLVITHRLGDDFSWVKEPRYAVQEHGKNWLAGQRVGPDLTWRVVTARWLNPDTMPSFENPYADPQAEIISPESNTWHFTWAAPDNDPTASHH